MHTGVTIVFPSDILYIQRSFSSTLQTYFACLVLFHFFWFIYFGQEEIESAKSAVHKLGASMLELRNSMICSLTL
jgi:hypothetical protein